VLAESTHHHRQQQQPGKSSGWNDEDLKGEEKKHPEFLFYIAFLLVVRWIPCTTVPSGAWPFACSKFSSQYSFVIDNGSNEPCWSHLGVGATKALSLSPNTHTHTCRHEKGRDSGRQCSTQQTGQQQAIRTAATEWRQANFTRQGDDNAIQASCPNDSG
jgi:hypothetical protein